MWQHVPGVRSQGGRSLGTDSLAGAISEIAGYPVMPPSGYNFGMFHLTCHIFLPFHTGKNINNLRYADDTTLMAGSEQELKSLLKVKEESGKSWLKT